MKFAVEFERGFWFFKNLVGYQLVEAESIGAAYEKVARDITAGLILGDRWKVGLIQQVADDAKPEDFRIMTIPQRKLELQEKASFNSTKLKGENK